MAARNLETDDLARLLICVEKHEPLKLQVLFTLLFSMPLRVTELLQLTIGMIWMDPTLADRSIVDENGIKRFIFMPRKLRKGGARDSRKKMGKPLDVFVLDRARAILALYLRARFPDGKVDAAAVLFPGECGIRPLSTDTVNRHLLTLCLRAGIDPTGVTSHAGKKTFSTEANENADGNLVITCALTGHADYRTLMSYLTPSRKTKQAVCDAYAEDLEKQIKRQRQPGKAVKDDTSEAPMLPGIEAAADDGKEPDHRAALAKHRARIRHDNAAIALTGSNRALIRYAKSQKRMKAVVMVSRGIKAWFNRSMSGQLMPRPVGLTIKFGIGLGCAQILNHLISPFTAR